MKNKKKYLAFIFLIVVILTFSPIVIPEYTVEPWFLGMPRTLWGGILISVVITLLTILLAFVVDEDTEEKM